MDTEPKKTRTKGGRPRKYESDAKRPTMAFRIRGGLYEKLKASADEREVSLSEEIEKRLEQSFQVAEDPMEEIALELIADNWRAIKSVTNLKFYNSVHALSAYVSSAQATLNLIYGLSNPSSSSADLLRSIIGERGSDFGAASALLKLLARTGLSTPEAKERLLDIMEDVEGERRKSMAKALAEALIKGASAEAPVLQEQEQEQEQEQQRAAEKTMAPGLFGTGAAGQSLPPFMARLAGHSTEPPEVVLQQPGTSSPAPTRRKAKARAKVDGP